MLMLIIVVQVLRAIAQHLIRIAIFWFSQVVVPLYPWPS